MRTQENRMKHSQADIGIVTSEILGKAQFNVKEDLRWPIGTITNSLQKFTLSQLFEKTSTKFQRYIIFMVSITLRQKRSNMGNDKSYSKYVEVHEGDEGGEAGSSVTSKRDRHSENQLFEICPTDEGMQMDERDGHEQNAESSIHERLE
jgi:hypothetical protein